MGLFGKSKKELEREEKDRKFEEYYGFSRGEALINATSMGESLGTLNLDAIIKLRSPGFYSVLMETYTDTKSNKDEIANLNKKYDKVIELLTKQNQLLGMLAANSRSSSTPANSQYR